MSVSMVKSLKNSADITVVSSLRTCSEHGWIYFSWRAGKTRML